MTQNLVQVAFAAECPAGSIQTLEINNVEIALVNYDGQFYALNNRCPHRGGQLGDGHLQGADLICPLHGWDFDVRTGISRYNSLDSVATYEVTVVEGKVFLNESDIPLEPKEYDDYLAKYRRPFDDREEKMNYVHYLSKGKREKT